MSRAWIEYGVDGYTRWLDVDSVEEFKLYCAGYKPLFPQYSLEAVVKRSGTTIGVIDNLDQTMKDDLQRGINSLIANGCMISLLGVQKMIFNKMNADWLHRKRAFRAVA